MVSRDHKNRNLQEIMNFLGPDPRQIRRKAAMAQLRCSGTETWVETTDLTEVLPMVQSRLLELQYVPERA